MKRDVRVGAVLLLLLALLMVLAGLVVGSAGLESPWGLIVRSDIDPVAAQILWDIRLPRSLGAWLAGALLGLAGAVAQGLFRNPLADPYLLGSASGASLGVSLYMGAWGGTLISTGWLSHLGMTGAAFCGAVLAVLLTLMLSRGVHQTLRLLLAGVVVGVVLGALTSLAALLNPELLMSLQSFLLGSTAFVGWTACAVMVGVLLVSLLVAVSLTRVLDGLALGEATALSLGLPVASARLVLIAVMALATGAAVAQTGLIGFVGLAAPHAVRSRLHVKHADLLLLSGLMGGLILLAADVLARGVLPTQELPVGVFTAVLGGGYLMWRMRAIQGAQS